MPMRPYRYSLLFLPLFCLLALVRGTAQDYAIYDSLPQLSSRIQQAGETTLVVNFWATWCKPCVEELPCFEELRKKYSEKEMQILLVSLDFKSQVEKKFIPFLKAQQLKSEVVLFADQKFNDWIPYIHKEWDGAIPVTLVIKGNQKAIAHGKFEDFKSLEEFVQPYIDDKSDVSYKELINCGK